MKNLGFIQLAHKDIFTEESEKAILEHERNGAKIEVEVDGGTWWIANVSVDGDSYNLYDSFNVSDFENFSNNDEISKLIEEGVSLEDACEKCAAKWYIRINDAAYAYCE